MDYTERRSCKRYHLYHPVMLHGDDHEPHLAEIVDAGRHGLRVRMTSQHQLAPGTTMTLRYQDPGNEAREPIQMDCRVAWQDMENLELGLAYLA